MNVPGIYSSVTFTFVGLGTEEYICVIFLGTEEFKKLSNISCFLVVLVDRALGRQMSIEMPSC
jgi:hypothetical protein